MQASFRKWTLQIVADVRKETMFYFWSYCFCCSLSLSVRVCACYGKGTNQWERRRTSRRRNLGKTWNTCRNSMWSGTWCAQNWSSWPPPKNTSFWILSRGRVPWRCPGNRQRCPARPRSAHCCRARSSFAAAESATRGPLEIEWSTRRPSCCAAHKWRHCLCHPTWRRRRWCAGPSALGSTQTGCPAPAAQRPWRRTSVRGKSPWCRCRRFSSSALPPCPSNAPLSSCPRENYTEGGEVEGKTTKSRRCWENETKRRRCQK